MKNVKSIAGILLLVVFNTTSCWGMFGFCLWEWNPSYWTQDERSGFVGVTLISVIVLNILIGVRRLND